MPASEAITPSPGTIRCNAATISARRASTAASNSGISKVIAATSGASPPLLYRQTRLTGTGRLACDMVEGGIRPKGPIDDQNDQSGGGYRSSRDSLRGGQRDEPRLGPGREQGRAGFQYVLALPRCRPGRTEQDRSPTERARRPPFRHGRRLQLFPG